MRCRKPFLASMILSACVTGAFAFGSREPLAYELSLGVIETYYLSLKASSGVEDQITLPLTITAPRNRIVMRYLIRVTNQDGVVVRTMEASYDGPKPGLFRKAHGLTLPTEISWDAKDNLDQFVPESTYAIAIEVWDDKNTRSASKPISVTIDNTAPVVRVTIPQLQFAPGGEGRQLIVIEQEGSLETLWQGAILSADGKPVRTFKWADSRPESVSWDGKNDSGEIVKDGSYSYRIASTDLAKNMTQQIVEGIRVDTSISRVEFSRNLGAISPNGDGVRDGLDFTIIISQPENVAQWTIDVLNGGGSSVRSIRGSRAPESAVVFDGKDDKGRPLAEGSYRPSVNVVFKNGTRLSADAPIFTVDLTPPKATVTASRAVFSPNGDGPENRIEIEQVASADESWTGEFRDPSGKIVREVQWQGAPDKSFVWNGRDNADAQLPDGTYTYTVRATDRAGNAGVSNALSITLKTEVKDAISLSVDGRNFSPNGDGVKDQVVLRIAPVVSKELSLSLSILGQDKKPVKTLFTGKQLPVEERVPWDGTNDGGQAVSDGSYYALLTAKDIAGNTKSVERELFVDTQAPTSQISLDYTLFSPDGDKNKDQLLFTQSSSVEESWTGEFKSEDGTLIRTFSWKGQAVDFAWDGRDAEGNIVADGEYSYVLKATDAAGNSFTARLDGILIDTKPTSAEISAGAMEFSPKSVDRPKALKLFVYANVRDGIESWRISILNSQAQAIKSFSGGSAIALPEELDWNGLDDAGKPSPDGSYSATLDVIYAKGNVVRKKTSSDFFLDAAAPSIELSLQPRRFTPNGDGLDDTIAIQMKAGDNRAISKWSIAILDPAGESFRSYSGAGNPPARIVWDGKSDNGELVQTVAEYPITVVLNDAAGNVTLKKDLITVDVFTTMVDGRLQIQVSSLIFAPDSAEFLNFGKYSEFFSGQAEKNAKVLDEIARALKQFGDYTILIEGHGVLVNWKDPTKAAVEQRTELLPLTKQRAEAVKAALIQRGIEESRLSTVGIGGLKPLYPFGDLPNRWKNRRVVFILEKK